MAEFDEKLNSILSDPGAMAQIMQLAQSLSGSQQTSPPPPPPVQQTTPYTGGMDPGLLMKLLPLVQELGSSQNSNAKTLLFALRPYLREDRQQKVERALQLARLFHIGKRFLTNWEG